MIGLFIVDTPVEEHMPPMEADGGVQLHYEKDGTVRGGWWLAAPADNQPTNLVMVDAKDQATLEAIGELEGCELWRSL